MKKGKRILSFAAAFVLVLSGFAAVKPETAKAAGTMGFETLGAGKLKVDWSAVEGAAGYYIERSYYDNTTWERKTDFRLKTTEAGYVDTCEWEENRYYYYTATPYRMEDWDGDGTAEEYEDSYESVSGGYYVPDIIGAKMALVVNKGKKRTLDIAAGYLTKEYCTIVNSNPSVASFSAKGRLTAKKSGSAKVTVTFLTGQKYEIKVKVPKKKTAAGSVYMSGDTAVMPVKSMIRGTSNRLNGTIRSDEKMKRLTISVYNAKGRAELRYTKTLSGKTVNLAKVSASVPFRKLKSGTKKIKIAVTNKLGTVSVYTAKFKVGKKPLRSKRGGQITAWAYTRLGDPYSQSKRGTSNYTDCSYFAAWCYKQGAGVTLPGTAAEQYKYCVKKKKTVRAGELRPGDLIFWGGADNGRYKGIWHVDVYAGDGLLIGAGSGRGGVTLGYFWGGYDDVYFGRPY